jgi:hypothetical protein
MNYFFSLIIVAAHAAFYPSIVFSEGLSTLDCSSEMLSFSNNNLYERNGARPKIKKKVKKETPKKETPKIESPKKESAKEELQQSSGEKQVSQPEPAKTTGSPEK